MNGDRGIKNVMIFFTVIVVIATILYICFIQTSRREDKPEDINNKKFSALRKESLNSKKNFPDLLGQFTTYYGGEEDSNRVVNIKNALNSINGTVIEAHEVFSYNEALGMISAESGYRMAGSYLSGKVVDTVGGGICQPSTTLYNAAVYANLVIVERHNHQFLPSYSKSGRDATIVMGLKDFKFMNNRNNPIIIVANVDVGSCTVQIYGTKEKTEYNIEIETEIIETFEPKTVYEENGELTEGTEYIVQNGKVGYSANTYVLLKLKDTVIAKMLLSQDKYNAMDIIIEKRS